MNCVAIITKHKSSKGTPKLTLMKILLMSLKYVSNWPQYNVVFRRKDVFTNFSKFTGSTCGRVVFLKKVLY